MSTLVIQDLKANVPGREILKGINLEMKSGEVHAIMGPNGSGKSTLSHILMGKPGYTDITGSILLDGEELIGKSTYERAHAGLFLAMQYPIEVPGVRLNEVLQEALIARGTADANMHATMVTEAGRIGFDEKFLERSLNVDLSGGEKKRNETLMMGVLKPSFAILDEIDSGLDVDALRAVSRRVEAATKEDALGVLAITHYSRLLTELHPDVIHILVNGLIVESGGPELADQLEATGYAEYSHLIQEETGNTSKVERPKIVDPWGDPLAGM